MLILLQFMVRRIKTLDLDAQKKGVAQQERSREQADEWRRQAEVKIRKEQEQRKNDIAPYDLSHALPVRDEPSFHQMLKAQARDHREDLDIQLARKQVLR